MDYEKKYNEALDRAKDWGEGKALPAEATTEDILKYIFPELADSVDERIRKWIVNFIEVRLPDAAEFEPEYRAALAYLEKQKAKEDLDRMAPIYEDKESFESALEKAWKFYTDSGAMTVDSFEDNYIECAFSKGFREGFLYKEKQKEQKTTEDVIGKAIYFFGEESLLDNANGLTGWEKFVAWLYCEFLRGLPKKLNQEYIKEQSAVILDSARKELVKMPDSTSLIEMWDKEKAILQERELRGDVWRTAQNAFMDGFAIGCCVTSPEQKPSDKVEPKFKVCDWIVNKQDEIARINQIKEDFCGTQRYYIEFTDGVKTDPMPCFADEEFRLWTIQDAKDGDVLAYIKDGMPFIYAGCYNDSVNSYCGLFSDTSFDETPSLDGYVEAINVLPATKEQRDLLFKKLKEAGYEWDAEKLELRKIEQKQVEHWQYVGTVELEKDEENQKPAEWSEEDDVNLGDIKCALYDYYGEERAEELYNWLKSLRPQPKKEWSKEIEAFNAGYKAGYNVGFRDGRNCVSYPYWPPYTSPYQPITTPVEPYYGYRVTCTTTTSDNVQTNNEEHHEEEK